MNAFRNYKKKMGKNVLKPSLVEKLERKVINFKDSRDSLFGTTCLSRIKYENVATFNFFRDSLRKEPSYCCFSGEKLLGY